MNDSASHGTARELVSSQMDSESNTAWAIWVADTANRLTVGFRPSVSASTPRRRVPPNTGSGGASSGRPRRSHRGR